MTKKKNCIWRVSLDLHRVRMSARRNNVRGSRMGPMDRVRNCFLTIKRLHSDPIHIKTKWRTGRNPEKDYVTHFLIQRETSTTGYQHCHIYVELSEQLRMNTLKKQFLCGQHNDAHFEKVVSDYEHCKAYITKQETRENGQFSLNIDGTMTTVDNPYSFGQPKALTEPQHKEAYKELVEMVYHKGMTMEDVVNHDPYNAGIHHKKLLFLSQISLKKRARALALNDFSIEIWCGCAGTGKTIGVQTHEWNTYKNSELFVIKKTHDGKEWWSLYDQQPAVVVEEYSPDWYSTDSILHFVDATSRMAGQPTKGGQTFCVAERMYLLSNLTMAEILNYIQHHQVEAFTRRIKRIVEFEATPELKHRHTDLSGKIERRVVGLPEISNAIDNYKSAMKEMIEHKKFSAAPENVEIDLAAEGNGAAEDAAPSLDE